MTSLTKRDVLTEYCSQRNRELANELRSRKAVFLDTKGWVHLRRAMSGEATQAAWLPALGLLRELVGAGMVFCPVSFTTIVEVLSQTDDHTRAATAALFDELSLGVGFCAPDEQLMDEVDVEMRRKVSGGGQSIVVWTRSCMTVMRPILLELDIPLPEGISGFERAFDEVWNTPISRFVGAAGYTPRVDISTAIDILNADNRAHAADITTFDALLATECRGIAEAAAKLTHARVRRHVVQQLIASGIPERVARASDERMERAAIVAWLMEALQTDEGRRRLPALYTHAAIHSQIRWMRSQRLRDNDLADHHQVAQAIGHCDALLVDRATRNVLVAAQIRLDGLYEAAVVVTPTELVEYLRTIVPAD